MPEPISADLHGKTCIVTGASAGIGREAARDLARLGARVVLACRNRDKGEAVRRDIAAGTGNAGVELMIVDLASQASVRAFGEAFAQTHDALHVLVNNAGIWTQTRQESPDGIELTWATNVLGCHLATQLLLPLLRKSAPARVVNVASELAGNLDLEDVEFERRRYRGITAYAQSKQADRMLTWAQARRLEGSGVTANALHPGGVNTELFRKAGGLVGAAATAYAALAGKTPAEGADTVTWLAASPEVEGVSGRFFADRRERRCRYRDEQSVEALWALCDSMTAPRS